MSDVRNYPDFAKRFMMFVFSFAGLAIISFALCFYFNGKGHETLSDIFIGLAALFTCIGLGGGSLKVFTVKCYVCRGKTKTIKNTEKDVWQAFCPKCNITWNLGLGINTD